MEFNTVLSHAKLVNGGEMKTRPASQPVFLHGSQVLLLVVFQHAQDPANLAIAGDQLRRLVLLNVFLLEFKSLLMALFTAKLHAKVDNGGTMINQNVFLLATTHLLL